MGHGVFRAAGCLFQGLQPLSHLPVVTGAADVVQTVDLLPLTLPVDPEQGDLRAFIGPVFVDSHGDAFFTIVFYLIDVRGVGYLPLKETCLQGRNHSAHVFDAPEILVAGFFQTVGHGLYEVAAAQRVHGIGDAGLVGDDLLGAKRL